MGVPRLANSLKIKGAAFIRRLAMNILASASSALDFATPCLLVPVWSDAPLSGLAAELDGALDGLISDITDNDGFKAKSGETRTLYTPGRAASRVILFGLGKEDKFTGARMRTAIAKAAKAARGLKKTEIAVALGDADAFAATEGLMLGLARYTAFKDDKESSEIETVTLLVNDEAAATSAIARAQIVANATLKCRDLVNTPSNLKSPAYFAQVAREIGEQSGIAVTVWDENKIKEEKMGALYGVGMGSDNPPRFIVMEYAPEGTQDDAPIALVGKGISFDSGGYSIKSAGGMEDMKDDMAGAGIVISVMSALKEAGIKKRVLGIVSSAENMISGGAQRPGDIVIARDGTSIEVLNTDAEGRLVLADALVWASEQKPAAIVDFATLTGAIGIALGQEGAGLFSNDDDLSAQLSASGEKVGEQIWRLPLWEGFDDAMKGKVSDLRNISTGRYAGSITAAIFLRHFVGEDIPWAHMDVAAVSLVATEKHLTTLGATGFGVRLVLDYLGE